ncbi:MAG: hypothetical protein EXR27_06625 [Betaproteobacteria bacterium]|nr:hypothetical protein [Betaproteobacteria bacterium]
MSLTALELVDRVEAYFAAADRCDVGATLACMTADCVLEYLTEGLRYEGRDSCVRDYFAARAGKVLRSWHGNFTHTPDSASGRIATRFNVRRTDQGVAERTADNINLFQFEGRLIKRISVWKGAGHPTMNK